MVQVLINEQRQPAQPSRSSDCLRAALPEPLPQAARVTATFHLAPDLFGRLRLCAQVILYRAGMLQVIGNYRVEVVQEAEAVQAEQLNKRLERVLGRWRRLGGLSCKPPWGMLKP
ncbi:MAG: hypothetical protein NT167_30610 [Verrucomicrobia bacterium]|nr:hypothetical protein [Verrucomicrobiota bacterium]